MDSASGLNKHAQTILRAAFSIHVKGASLAPLTGSLPSIPACLIKDSESRHSLQEQKNLQNSLART